MLQPKKLKLHTGTNYSFVLWCVALCLLCCLVFLSRPVLSYCLVFPFSVLCYLSLSCFGLSNTCDNLLWKHEDPIREFEDGCTFVSIFGPCRCWCSCCVLLRHVSRCVMLCCLILFRLAFSQYTHLDIACWTPKESFSDKASWCEPFSIILRWFYCSSKCVCKCVCKTKSMALMCLWRMGRP